MESCPIQGLLESLRNDIKFFKLFFHVSDDQLVCFRWRKRRNRRGKKAKKKKRRRKRQKLEEGKPSPKREWNDLPAIWKTLGKEVNSEIPFENGK